MLRQGKGGREPRFPVSHSVFSEPALASLLGLLGEPAVAGCECGLAGAWEMAVRRNKADGRPPWAARSAGKGAQPDAGSRVGCKLAPRRDGLAARAACFTLPTSTPSNLTYHPIPSFNLSSNVKPL
jgi:hypothetical protein